MLEIRNLCVCIDGKQVLKNFSLIVKKGEIHAIMGPNGAGKSTVAKVLAGHPAYEITSGEILFEGIAIHDMAPEERAYVGIFMGFQYPIEIPGVTNEQFLLAAYNALRKHQEKSTLNEEEFAKILEEKMQLLSMDERFKGRFLNEGLSGGEKKRNEILQLAVLEPKLVILDEIDSGLDIDAMKIVAAGICQLQKEQPRGLILITHYQRLLNYIQPNFVHVVKDGAVVASGGAELALKLEECGYDWVEGSHVNA